MPGNFFDQFDAPAAAPGGNFFDQFDASATPAAPAKRQVGFWEGFGRRAVDAFYAAPETASAIAGLLPLAVDKVAGTDLYGPYARTFIAPNTRAREVQQIKPEAEELTTGGRWGQAFGALPRDLALAAVTSGRSAGEQAAAQAVQSAPTIANAVRAALPEFARGARAMAPTATIEGRDKYDQLRAQGVSEVDASLSAMNTSANALVGGALPLATPGGVLKRATVGGAAGVTQAAEERAVDNLILPQQAQAGMSFEDASMSAVPAALMAAILGPRARPGVLEQVNANRARERAAADEATAVIERQTVVPPEGQTLADVIAQATGAKNRPESTAEWQTQRQAEGQARRQRGAELRQTFRGVDLPPDAPVANSAEQAVRQDYQAAGLDPDSIAAAFNRGRAAEGMDLPPAQRDITAAENNDTLARQAFDIAAARQARADADLAQRGELAPDYQAGNAAATGGRMDSGTRRVTLLDGTEPVDIIGVADNGSIRVQMQDAGQTVLEVPAAEVAQRMRTVDLPQNQRLAQDFVARSDEPPRGVGVETMAGESMPRRSTDRIAGDQVGGRASMVDPVTRDGGSPPEGQILPAEPRGDAPQPQRAGQTYDVQTVPEPEALPAPTRALPAPAPTRDAPPAAPAANARARRPSTRIDPEADLPDWLRTSADRGEPKEPKRRDLRRELRDAGGIHVSEAADMGFKNAAEANRAFPGLFKRNGMRLDGVVEWASGSGWIQAHEIEAADRDGVGGSHELARAAIRDRLDTRGDGAPHMDDADAVYAYAQEMKERSRQRRVAEGLEDDALTVDAEVQAAIARANAVNEGAVQDLSAQLFDEGNEAALLAALKGIENGRANTEGQDSRGVPPREGAGAGNRSGGAPADEGRDGPADGRAGQTGGQDLPGRAGGVDDEPGFQLKGQTQDEVKAQEAQRRTDERRDAEAARAAEDKARADSEVAGFELTGEGLGDGRNGDLFGNTALSKDSAKSVEDAADLGDKIKGDPNAGRLNAGIPVDVLWSELKKLSDKWGVTKGVQELRRDLGQLATGDDPGKTREMAVPYLLRTIMGSTQGHMRALESITGSEAMTKIRQHFDSKPGDAEGVGETYGEAIQRVSVGFRNRLFKAMKPFLDDAPEAASQRQQLARLLQNRGAIRGNSPLHTAARELASMLDDALKHMKDAGVGIEATTDYFPRMIDSLSVLRNGNGFMEAARAAYKAAGMSDGEAKSAAQAWHTAIVSGHHGISENPFSLVSSAVPTANMAKHRKMPKESEEALRKFYVQDPLDALQLYIHKAVRRAEWERRFGGEVSFKDQNGHATKGTRMQALQARLVAEGHGAIVETMQRLVQAATGEVPNAVSARWRTAISWSHSLTVIQYLRHATITSLTEPILTGARTGNVSDIGRGYLYAVQDIQNRVASKLGQDWMQNKTARESKQIAEMLGHLESDLAASVHTVLQADGMLESSKIASKLAHRATIYSGLRQWTDATRSATMRVGMNFLGSLADDVADGNKPALTRHHLADLGVPEGRQKAFADWVRAGGKPGEGSMGQLYTQALGRFMNQVIMQPTNADKPRYANHPVGSVAYGLTSYIYAFQNNVLNRMARMVKQAVDRNTEFSARERLALVAPIMAVPMAAIAQYALGYARDAVLGDEEKVAKKDKEVAFRVPGTQIDVPQRVAEAVSRAGTFGAADPWVNIATSAKYERDPTTLLVGPVGANWQKLLMDSAKMFTNRNSPNTATHERQIMKDVYNTMIDPVVSTAALYLPGPAAVVVNQAMARQGTREGFARAAGDALHGATGW